MVSPVLILLTKAKDWILLSSAMLGQPSNAFPICHIPIQPSQYLFMHGLP